MGKESKSLVIGTRGSALALRQTNYVRDQLVKIYPGLDIQIKIIKTTGDKIQKLPLPAIGEKGLFTRELNNAILSQEIDCAVHSLKDLPTEMPEGIVLAAVLDRRWRADALVSLEGKTVEQLPHNAVVATSSLRRKSFLLSYRSDFRFIDIRGNVDTRIRKVKELGYDALVLAEAGIRRLGLDETITQVIPFEILPPSPAQGALGVTIAADNAAAAEYFRALDTPRNRIETTAERTFLAYLEGGCHVPIGSNAVIQGELLLLEGALGDLDGSRVVRERMEASTTQAEQLGISLAKRVLNKGGQDILDKIRRTIEHD